MRHAGARWLILVLTLTAAVIGIFDLGAVPLLAVLSFIIAIVYYESGSTRSLEYEARSEAGRAERAEIRAAATAAEAAKLLAVIESVTEGILQVSDGGRIIHANLAAREMLRLPPHVEGQSAAAFIRNPDLRSCIERAAAGQSCEPAEINFEDRQLLVSSQALRSNDNSASTGAVVALVDLTEFRRMESVRRDFVANVSHELKTPLTAIRGYTETLLNDELAPELQRQFLEVVHRNADRIQRIVDDLLDLSRLQSGGWRPELQTVDIALLAEDVWIGCEAGHRKNINFGVSPQTDPTVIADPGGLRQVLSNLFENAIRYTPPGGNLAVTVEQNPESPVVTIAVADSGSGIPQDALPRIFERFYRVDPARSREAGGTGLGLAIVRHLVERMGGDVSATSELGKGTTITFSLPAPARE